MPRKLEVRDDSLEIADSFHYLGDVFSCGEGVELAVRNRISCAWIKWRALVSLLVRHSIPIEERANIYGQKTGRTASSCSCDHRQGF